MQRRQNHVVVVSLPFPGERDVESLDPITGQIVLRQDQNDPSRVLDRFRNVAISVIRALQLHNLGLKTRNEVLEIIHKEGPPVIPLDEVTA